MLGGSAVPEQVGVLECSADGALTKYTGLRVSLSGELPPLEDFSVPQVPTCGRHMGLLFWVLWRAGWCLVAKMRPKVSRC